MAISYNHAANPDRVHFDNTSLERVFFKNTVDSDYEMVWSIEDRPDWDEVPTEFPIEDPSSLPQPPASMSAVRVNYNGATVWFNNLTLVNWCVMFDRHNNYYNAAIYTASEVVLEASWTRYAFAGFINDANYNVSLQLREGYSFQSVSGIDPSAPNQYVQFELNIRDSANIDFKATTRTYVDGAQGVISAPTTGVDGTVEAYCYSGYSNSKSFNFYFNGSRATRSVPLNENNNGWLYTASSGIHWTKSNVSLRLMDKIDKPSWWPW